MNKLIGNLYGKRFCWEI